MMGRDGRNIESLTTSQVVRDSKFVSEQCDRRA